VILTAHLAFGGNCEAAFRFYEKALGGQLELFKQDEKVVHATLSFAGQRLMGADVPEHDGTRGFFLHLKVSTRDEAERIFNALAGEVKMPLQKTFWSSSFGVVVDPYGVAWEIDA
jgi:PhnB protein